MDLEDVDLDDVLRSLGAVGVRLRAALETSNRPTGQLLAAVVAHPERRRRLVDILRGVSATVRVTLLDDDPLRWWLLALGRDGHAVFTPLDASRVYADVAIPRGGTDAVDRLLSSLAAVEHRAPVLVEVEDGEGTWIGLVDTPASAVEVGRVVGRIRSIQ